jgi:hypothetical protein
MVPLRAASGKWPGDYKRQTAYRMAKPFSLIPVAQSQPPVAHLHVQPIRVATWKLLESFCGLSPCARRRASRLAASNLSMPHIRWEMVPEFESFRSTSMLSPN